MFLHEWLHTLGAIHVGNPSRILCPTYSDQSSQLWGADVAAAEAALADRRAASQAGTAVVEWKALKASAAPPPAQATAPAGPSAPASPPAAAAKPRRPFDAFAPPPVAAP